MWKFAGTLRLLLAPAVACWSIVLIASFALAACSRAAPQSTTIASKCLRVGGDKDTTLPITSPGTGTLSVKIAERGISVMGQLDGQSAQLGESPVERFGSITLLTKAAASKSYTVRIRSADSKDISGETCVSAELLDASASARAQADRALAAAGIEDHLHEWEASFDDYRAAALQFDRIGEPRQAAGARHAMAQLAYGRLDRKRDTLALANDALSAYEAVTDPLPVGLLTALRAEALLDLPGLQPAAVAFRVRALLTTARKYLGASDAGARELPRLEIMSGFLDYKLDAPTQARRFFEQAAAECRGSKDWDCYGIASQNLAILAEADHNYAFALAAYGEALEALGPDLDPKMSALIWTNLGRVQGVMGLFSISARSQETAMREYAQFEDCTGVRRALSRSGSLLVQIGSISDAENDLQQAASLDCSALLSYAKTLAQGATIPAAPEPMPTDSMRDASTTAQAAQEALCTNPLEVNGIGSDNKTMVFNSLLSLGEALMLEGDAAQAQRCLGEAQNYAASSRSQIRLTNARGDVLLARGDATKALEAFEQAVHIADGAKLPSTYEHRGTAQIGIARAALLAGNGPETLQVSRLALKSSVARGDIDQTVMSLRLIAAGQRASASEVAAARTLQVATDLSEAVPIDELDGEKRATYLATQHTVFTELTDLFASRNSTLDVWAGFVTSERGRARSLRYAIAQETRDASAPLQAPPVSRYQKLLRDVTQISSGENDAADDALIEDLDRAALTERRAVEPFDKDHLTHILDQLDATLVEYAVGTHDMFAFVMNGSNARVVNLGDRLQIANAADALYERLRDSESPASAVRSAAVDLAKRVLWPISNQLSRKKIVVVPDDALHKIPFDVLPWSANPTDRLVLHHVEVSIVPSALFLTRARGIIPQRGNAPRIALIGDPVFRVSDWRRQCVDVASGQANAQRVLRTVTDWSESLPRLPGTRAEVLMVANLARQSRSGSHVEMLLGCEAVPSALRHAADEHLDLLHIATHARVDSQRPRLSALALTPEISNGSPTSAFGLLDILGMKLDSSLVVLSACETSRGRLLPGEGVLGPAQAFLQAGAAAVVASYWRVDDQTTSHFMQQFYRYLLVEKLPASTALHRAQLDQASISSSYDWAAFALYGSPDAGI
jgi:CHAT domain-containing protein